MTPAGFEPAISGFVDRRSVHLSYGAKIPRGNSRGAKLRGKGSNLRSLDSKSSVLPVTPPRNMVDGGSIELKPSSAFQADANPSQLTVHFKAAGRSRTCIIRFRKPAPPPFGNSSRASAELGNRTLLTFLARESRRLGTWLPV